LILAEVVFFFISGPPAMVNAMLAVLRELGLLEDRIRSESFPGY
jgi:ferredoxin-NADP reductase